VLNTVLNLALVEKQARVIRTSHLPVEYPMTLLQLYIPLTIWVGLGIILGRTLPAVVARRLGVGLFWVGVPLGIMIFLRQADLSGNIWIAPLVSWSAVGLGAAIATGWMWFTGQSRSRLGRKTWPPSTQGSFLNASMFGNTGYLGYPVTLALVGPQYFAWAVFYDTLGSTLASYGMGVAMASNFGDNPAIAHRSSHVRRTAIALLKNPALWGFTAGLGFQRVELPASVETVLQSIAWTVIAFSLLLLGMRLSQVSTWAYLQQATISLSIKMLIVPLLLALVLGILGITGAPRLVLVLQAAMPPAFATLILAEAYNLDRDLTVTALAVGSVGLLFTLPVWLK